LGEICEVFCVYVSIWFCVCSEAPIWGLAVLVLPEGGEDCEVGSVYLAVAG
jgi:hypothetical protein